MHVPYTVKISLSMFDVDNGGVERSVTLPQSSRMEKGGLYMHINITVQGGGGMHKKARICTTVTD